MNHPFIMADRFESQREGQHLEDEDVCNLSFYGYVRGSSLRVTN